MLSLFSQVCPLHLYCIGLLSPLHYFFLVYYHIFKLKRGKSKKPIHLPPKEEGVFLEILDKSMWRYFNLLQSEWGKIRKRGDLKPHFVMILLNNGEIRQIFFRVPNELSTW